MRMLLLFICLLTTGSLLNAADSLQVLLNTTSFVKGDTLEFACTVPDYAKLKLAGATLNIWIEDVEKTKRWKYRYPVINGEVSGSLIVSEKIPDGRYAVNFLLQRGFFKVTGEVVDHEKKDTALNFMMIPKNKPVTYFDQAHVGPDGRFRLKSTLFADSAYFIFSPVKKTRNNNLLVKIETPLDSAFTPVLYISRFITIGDPKMLVTKKTDTTRYVFKSEEALDINLLPDVIVNATYKKKVELFDEQYSSNLFKRDDAMVFDGLENDDISRSVSILMFLQSRVPGLTIERGEDGTEIARWRNEAAEIYIDEFKVQDSANQFFIAPTDVAMIKVYRPPAQLMGSSGGAGAIAIYTKKGIFANSNRAKHNFIVKGYTTMDSIWQ